jgi:HlyD family secretion protein
MRSRVAIACALGALLASGCGNGSKQSASVVDLGAVERRDIVVTAEATGVVEPIQIVEIKSKASGEILRMAVETGQVVQKGDLLVQVDTEDLTNALQQAKADLEVAEASLTVSKAQKERSDQLLSNGLISEEEHEQAQLGYATSKAQLVKAKTNLTLAQERYNDATVRAPSAGTILEKNVEEGTIISSATSQVSGGTVLLKMADLSNVQVRTLVDETDIGKIKPGQRASLKVEAYRDHDFEGTVLKIEPLAVVQQNVTMFAVLTQIPNEEGLLKPGMNADVEIHIARKNNVLSVPVEAVRSVREMAILAPLVNLTSEDVTSLGGSMAGAGGRPGGGGTAGLGPNSPGAAGGDSARAAAAMEHGGRTGGAREGGPRVAHGAGGSPGGSPRQPGAFGGAGFRPRAAGGQGGARSSTGIAFVKSGGKFVPRVVTTGISDWDHIEVVSGLEEGDEVALLPSAQLYMERQQMMERFRSRSSVVG